MDSACDRMVCGECRDAFILFEAMKSALRSILVQIAIAVVVVVILAFLAGSDGFLGTVEEVQSAVKSWGMAGWLAFPAMVTVATVLFLPGGILSLGGGFFFGMWWGTALVLIGNLLGAALAFFVGRKLGRSFVRHKLLRDPRWLALDSAIVKHGPRIIFFSQLNPLFPTSLFNYLYGITRVKFWVCLKWVALGRLPGIFLYCYLGTLGQLGIGILRGDSRPGSVEYFVWGGGLLLTVVVAALLGRTATKVIEEYRRLAPPTAGNGEDD